MLWVSGGLNMQWELKFVTSNKHKFEEAKEILKNYKIKLQWIKMSVEEPRGHSVEEVARKSLESLLLFRKVPSWSFLEDAGLFIRALNGFPGVYSAYVYSTIGYSGILKLMKDVKDRYAEFRSAVALYDGKRVLVFTGKCSGIIGFEARGIKGFGFDPIFIPEGFSQTFAELGEDIKNKISHRARALQAMAKYLLGLSGDTNEKV